MKVEICVSPHGKQGCGMRYAEVGGFRVSCSGSPACAVGSLGLLWSASERGVLFSSGSRDRGNDETADAD